MKVGFDIISDLNLTPENPMINWENKATSLYCLVAGNISNDLRTIVLVLTHLSKYYQGVFYTPGSLEFKDVGSYYDRIDEIEEQVKRIRNVAVLHHQVVIIDGVAILGCPGWYGDEETPNYEEAHGMSKFEDLLYLKNSIEKLQKHLDVKKIILLTHSVPHKDLYFREIPQVMEDLPDLAMLIAVDMESKISHWVYGSYGKVVDVTVNNINYLSNPYTGQKPYWAKRIEIEI